MPWTTPKTWVTEEIVTSANLNTHLRDNTAWVGSDHPRVIATRTTIQNTSSNTDAAIVFTASSPDVGNLHDPGVNATRFTVPSGGGGMYYCVGQVDWAANSTGRRLCKLRVDGTTAVWVGQYTEPPLELWTSTVSGFIQLTAGQYVELTAVQISGGTLAVNGAIFGMNWVGT